MGLLNLRQIVRPAHLFAAAIALMAAGPAAAQTSIKFSLDGRLEGPAATFLFPQDKGYFRSEGLDVTLDEAASVLDPITRVASGAYDMGLADINALIKYRDQHPSPPVQAVFMVYNKPPYAIVARKSRGITEPKQLENKKLGAPPAGITFGAMAAIRQAQQHRCVEGDDRNHRHPGARAHARRRPDRCRARLLVPALCRSQGPRRAGRRYRADADGGLRAQALRQRHHHQSQIRGRQAGGGESVSARLSQGPEGDRQTTGRCGRCGRAARRRP